MNDLNIRFKDVRLALHKNQSEFASMLGFAQTGISAIELGKRNISDRHIKVLCSVCNVNEQWFRSGEGNMFVQTDTSLIDELAAEYNMSDKQKRILAAFAAMDDKKREILAETFFEFLDLLAVSPEVSATLAVRPADDDRRLTRAEKEAIMKRQLDAEEKAAMSSAFIGISGTEKIG